MDIMRLRYIAYLMIACLAVSGMAFRLRELQTRLIPHPGAKTAPRVQTEDHELFNQLKDAGLLTSGPNDRLELPSRDYARILRFRGSAMPLETLEHHEKLIQALYGSPAGSVIQTQAELWNESRYMAAVRDDRAGPDENQADSWRVFDSQHPEWEYHRTGARVPVDFGYVNQGELRPGFTDWKAAYGSETVEFRSVIETSAPRDICIQVIGMPVPPYPRGIQPQPCYSPRASKERMEKPADAYVFRLKLNPGPNPFRIKADPIPNQETRMDGVSIRKTQDGFEWIGTGPPRRPSGRKPPAILTADEILLTDERGNPTPECRTLGLSPLTGFGKHTPYGLWAILANSLLPDTLNEVRLTIDARFQSPAQELLDNWIANLFPGEHENPSLAEYARDRRAAVVILNLNTGAILAAAGYPRPPVGLHPWDAAAFAKIYPSQNPVQVRAWKGMNRHSAPGSTFKPVIALAAIDAAPGNPKVEALLRGFPAASFERSSGLTLNCMAYDPESGQCTAPGRPDPVHPAKIHNYGDGGRTRLGDSFKKGDDRLGLVQAVRDSVNVWFVHLAMVTDGPAAQAYDRKKRGRAKIPLPDFRIAQKSAELGFDSGKIDLAPVIPPEVRLWRSVSGEGDALTAHAGKLDLTNTDLEVNRVQVLAQNAIGHSVVATPLQMARTAAAISKQHLVHPFLIQGWGSAPVPFPIPEPYWTWLRNGMNAVPDAQGTAGKAFSDFPDRKKVYAKTGTANVAGESEDDEDEASQKNYFTTWFIGTYEPEGQSETRPPIAFACMVTHAYGRDRNTGGRVSAPIISDILKRCYGEDKK
jgi:cell division protein FtsI/penicillin-binding protein 2